MIVLQISPGSTFKKSQKSLTMPCSKPALSVAAVVQRQRLSRVLQAVVHKIDFTSMPVKLPVLGKDYMEGFNVDRLK